MREQGLPVLPHQSEALKLAAQALDALRPEAARDLAAAFTRRPDLVGDAAAGRSHDAIRAMGHEAAIRLDPALRAERFVGDWKQLDAHRTQLREQGDEAGARKLASQMRGMAKGLERDPELDAKLHGKVKELGLEQRSERSLHLELADTLGKERNRPFEIGL